MKTFLLLSFYFTMGHFVSAQVKGTVTSSGSQPVPFANVAMFNVADSTLHNGSTTDMDGLYSITASPGRYFLRVTAIGYSAVTTPAFNVDGPHTLDSIYLEEERYELNEVVVRAEKPVYTQQIDRTVVNVENSMMTKGSTALQLLERSPGVFVDVRNGLISMNGKNGVMVMINGKLIRIPAEQLMAMLNAMNGTDIEKIELLPTPPASYDSDGNAGMINIVTKRSIVLGTNGSITVGAGYGWKEKANISASLSHNRVNSSFYASYSFMHDRSTGGWSAIGSQLMPSLGGHLDVVVANKEKANANNHNINVGYEQKTNTFAYGANLSVSGSVVDRKTSNDASYTMRDSDSVLVMHSRVQGTNRWINSIGSVYARKEFKRGDKLSVDLDYIDYRNVSPTEVHNVFTDAEGNEGLPPGSIFMNRQRGRAKSPIGIAVGKFDYIRPLSEKASVESGAKATFSSSNGVSYIQNFVDDSWQGSDRMTNNIDVREQILAAYGILNWKPTPSLNIVAGARYEYSRTTSDSEREENRVDRKMSNLFPNVSLSKKLSERSEIQISFSQRISRPSYNDMASNLVYADPMSAFTGNPLLRPTLTTNLRAGYNANGFLFSLLASRDDYPIIRYQLTESANRDLMYVSAQNLRYLDNLTLAVTVPVKIAKWWDMNYSATGSVRRFKVTHTREPVLKSYATWTINGSQVFTLPKDISIELSGWYNADHYDGSKSVDGFGALNAGVKKNFRRGSLQLVVTDLFQTLKYVNRYGLLTDEAFSVRSDVPYRPESARFHLIRLTWTHTLGNGKGGTRKNVEEENRISRG